MSASARLFGTLSPAGSRARLSIFIFHRVLPEPDPLFPEIPDATRFSRLLQWLTTWFNVIPLDEAARLLAAGRLPERAAAITFDDGYSDNATIALPLLREAGAPATFFIATGYLDGGRMWNDTIIESVRGCARRALDLHEVGMGSHEIGKTEDRTRLINALLARAKYLPKAQRVAFGETVAKVAGADLPENLMLSSAQVRDLHRAGMQIGAHTISHPILANLSLDEAHREIDGSKRRLESLLGERVSLFAYPNGRLGDDYTLDHARLVRDIGFEAAVTTHPGTAGYGADLAQLPRFTPWDQSRLRFGARLVRNLMRSRRLAA